MTGDQLSSFTSALESANVKDYFLVTDMSTCIYNNDSAVIKQNGEMVVGIRKALYANYRSNNGLELVMADASDIHEARVFGTSEQMKQIAESLGASLSDNEYKMLIQLDKKDVDLEPATGNYIQFVFMPEALYNEMTDEQKALYDEAKKFESKPLPNFKYLGATEYGWLNDTDKAEYDRLVLLYTEKREKYLAPNQAASISFN